MCVGGYGAHLELLGCRRRLLTSEPVNPSTADGPTKGPLFSPAAELDAGFGGFAADMAMDGMDGGLMAEDYHGTLLYDRQPYA